MNAPAPGFTFGQSGSSGPYQPFEHPSLRQRVTEEQRDRATSWLQEAYADGRLSEDDFDQRIGQVIGADTRRDLNAAFYGLVSVPMTSQALGVHPAYQPVTAQTQKIGRGAAAFAHFSALLTWIFGPLLVYLTSSRGTYARREAAKAFNFQVTAALAFIVGGIVTMILPNHIDNIVMPIIWLGWLLGTIIGGARAAQGEDWTNPVKKVLRFEILSEKEGR